MTSHIEGSLNRILKNKAKTFALVKKKKKRKKKKKSKHKPNFFLNPGVDHCLTCLSQTTCSEFVTVLKNNVGRGFFFKSHMFGTAKFLRAFRIHILTE